MSSRTSTSSLRPRTSQPAATVAPVQAQVIPAAAAAVIESADEKRVRQQYTPRSITEYESEITGITEKVRSFKTRLYPSSSNKAATDGAPTRREFDEVITAINGLKKDYKAVSRRMAAAPKRKTVRADGAGHKGGFTNPCVVDEEMAHFINDVFGDEFAARNIHIIDNTRVISRAILTSALARYVDTRNLRDGTMITPDAALLKLFERDFVAKGVDSKSFTHTHMQKLITDHVLKAEEFKAYIASNKIDLESYKDGLESVLNYFKSTKPERVRVKKEPKAKVVEQPAEATA